MKTRAYADFSRKIHACARARRTPLRVMFELTYRCNFDCGHCYVPSCRRKEPQGPELGIRDIRVILRELKKAGCLYLGFTGGEPLLRADILDILLFARQCGFITTLNTNASLIDEAMAEGLSRAGVSKVDVTLPAVTERVFRRVVGVAGGRDRVFDGLNFLREHKVAFALKSCVLKANFSEIGDLRKQAKQWRVALRLDDTLFPAWDGSRKPFLLRRRLSETRRALARGRSCRLVPPREWARDVFSCGAGLTQAAITPAGALKFCLDINYPNHDILDMGFGRAWRMLNALARSVKIDRDFACGTCRHQALCGWCPGYSWIMTKTFTRCPGLHELYQA